MSRRERRQPLNACDETRCVALVEGGVRCTQHQVPHRCPYCGGPLCGHHYEDHLKQEQKLIAWRNACEGKRTPTVHAAP